ncbi:MAG: phosphoadenylyl-sulfate reductase [Bauldia sp.]
MAPLDALARVAEPEAFAPPDVGTLNALHGSRGAEGIIDFAAHELFPGRIALVSSFGAESAVLLSLVAEVDRSLPVVFLDTGKLFAETIAYRHSLADHLGLTDVRTIIPDPDRLAAGDPHGALWMTNPDLCCHYRKTEPLNRALSGFDAWFTGRKRFQNRVRAELPVFEADGDRIKVNPLVNWSSDDLKAYTAKHALPEHPLVAKGFLSIGCVPCTTKVAPGEDPRAGRWRGLGKIECGIHTDLEIDGSGI